MSSAEIKKRLASLSPPQAALAKRLLPDFHLSFMYSQGSDSLQETLFDWMYWYYQRRLPPDQRRLLKCPAPEMRDAVIYMPLPRHHEKIHASVIADAYEQKWDEMERTFRVGSSKTAGQLATRFAVRTLDRDLRFARGVGKSRPGRPGHPDSDRYASLFRTHIMLGTEAASPTYQGLFNEVRKQEAAVIREADSRPADLAAAWDARFPKTCFYTGAVMLRGLAAEHRTMFHQDQR